MGQGNPAVAMLHCQFREELPARAAAFRLDVAWSIPDSHLGGVQRNLPLYAKLLHERLVPIGFVAPQSMIQMCSANVVSKLPQHDQQAHRIRAAGQTDQDAFAWSDHRELPDCCLNCGW